MFLKTSATGVIRLLVHHTGSQFGSGFKDDQFTCLDKLHVSQHAYANLTWYRNHALRSMSYTTAAGLYISATNVKKLYQALRLSDRPMTSELLRTL